MAAVVGKTDGTFAPWRGRPWGTLIALVGAATLAALLVHSWIFTQWSDLRLRTLEDANLEFARALSVAFERYVLDIRRHEQLAIGFDLTTSKAHTPEQTSRLFERSIREYKAVGVFSLADADGRIVASSDPKTIGGNVAGQDFFRFVQDTKGWAVTDLQPGKDAGPADFIIAQSVCDDQGTFRWVVFATVYPERFGRYLISFHRPRRGTIVLFDRSGTLVYAQPESQLAQRNWRKLDSLLDQALAGNDASGILRNPTSGETYISARVPVPDTGWVVGASSPLQEVIAPIARMRRVSLGCILLVAALSVAAVLGLRRANGPTTKTAVHEIGADTEHGS